MLKLPSIILLGTLGLSALTIAVGWRAMKSAPKPQADPQSLLFRRFEKEIWPLLARGQDHSCVGCHDAENSSELHFFSDPQSSFTMLVEKNYFATNTPDSLLGRLTSTHPKTQMPKGKAAQLWTTQEIQRLSHFAADLDHHVMIAGNADEQFPAALLTAYKGPIPDTRDNQFISYRQLRGKIATIFQDDWMRRGRDLFQENVALFGGADFKERFNETTKASATFLTGMEMLSRDVAARAYTQKLGPFAGRADELPAPLGMAKPDEMAQDTNKKKKDRKVSGKIARQKLGHRFLFKPSDSGQCFKLSNINTVGNVSFYSIEIEPLGNAATNQIQRIVATNSIVEAEGAWKIEERKGLVTFEDENNDKGNSAITIPITVHEEGEYEITICWRQGVDNAEGVLAEVFSVGANHLAQPPAPSVPPAGEADYFIDETLDTVAFADLQASFLFGADDYVEINNKGTHNRVTADAVKFITDKNKTSFLVDNDEAEGKEAWQEYKGIQFEAYNKIGKNTFHDDNAHKGDLFLRYKPSSKTNLWNADTFYHVSVGYPAKKDHETRTPVVIKAKKSSPIVQLVYPARARVEAQVEIDASSSYTLQGSKMKFIWQQLDGPALKINQWHEPILKFQVPSQDVQQVAWEGSAEL